VPVNARLEAYANPQIAAPPPTLQISKYHEQFPLLLQQSVNVPTILSSSYCLLLDDHLPVSLEFYYCGLDF